MIATKTTFLNLILLQIFMILSSCINPSDSYLEKKALLDQIRQVSDNLCTLNINFDRNKPLNAAVIYFNQHQYSLKNNDKEILDKIALINKYCNRKIIVIAHNSNVEFNQDSDKSTYVSYLRAKNIKNYLENQRVPSSYIIAIFCNNTNNRVQESRNDKHNYLFNQRVEIIMDNLEQRNQIYCFKEKPKINNRNDNT
jgi:outer membrane protein OmpA-like peptidoglycan-associated protein